MPDGGGYIVFGCFYGFCKAHALHVVCRCLSPLRPLSFLLGLAGGGKVGDVEDLVLVGVRHRLLGQLPCEDVVGRLFAAAFGSKLIYRRKGERFARLRRMYSPINICPVLRPVLQVKTAYKRLEDVPKHCGLIARGFELVVAETLGGKHVGDDAGNVDVIHPVYGRIETKVGEGRLYYAGVIK